MMEIIMLHANLMEETVVDPMWTKRSAQCVHVLKGLEFQMVALRKNTKEMEYVMMEITMLTVTLMEEIAVYPKWTNNSALNVPVKTRQLEVAKKLTTKGMVSVMMEIITLHAIMMEETVVDRRWKHHSAQCVPVLKRLELAKSPITKVIKFVMTEITMLGVTLMEEIAVYPM